MYAGEILKYHSSLLHTYTIISKSITKCDAYIFPRVFVQVFPSNLHRSDNAAVYLCMPRKWKDKVQKLTNALNAAL